MNLSAISKYVCSLFLLCLIASCKRPGESKANSEQVISLAWLHDSNKFNLCWVSKSAFSSSENLLVDFVQNQILSQLQHSPLRVNFSSSECPSEGSFIRIYSLKTDPTTGKAPVFAGLAHIGKPSITLRNYETDSRGYPKGIMINSNRFSDCGNGNPHCLSVALMHEFGHSLGLDHELSHAEAKGCKDYARESKVTDSSGRALSKDFNSYDETSIMNYCAALGSEVPMGKRSQFSLGDQLAFWEIFGRFRFNSANKLSVEW
jgi:hypothetical protein